MSNQLDLFGAGVHDLTQKLPFPTGCEDAIERCEKRRAADAAAFTSTPVEVAQPMVFDGDCRHEWSEANLCLCWVTKSDGRAWFDWWEEKPKFERDFLLKLYREERQDADLYNHGHMTPFDLVWSHIDRRAKEEEALINRWALEIRTAAQAMKPIPFASPEEIRAELGYVPWQYPHRLACAIARAGIIVIQAAPAEPKRRGKRNAA